jgi:hypothetical protein
LIIFGCARRNLDQETRGVGGLAAKSVGFPTRHRRPKFAARLHTDLLVGVPEVPFDGLERHEQRLGDLPVAVSTWIWSPPETSIASSTSRVLPSPAAASITTIEP